MAGISQILIAVSGMIAMGFLALAYFLLTPLFLPLQHAAANQAGNDTTSGSRPVTVITSMYNLWFFMFAIFLGGTVIALYARASRKDTIEESSGDAF